MGAPLLSPMFFVNGGGGGQTGLIVALSPSKSMKIKNAATLAIRSVGTAENEASNVSQMRDEMKTINQV